MARDYKIRKCSSIKVEEERKGWKRMEVVNKKKSNISQIWRIFYVYCYYCHNFGHKSVDYRTKRKYLSKESKKKTRSVRRVAHGKMWRINEDSKNIEETNISRIKEASQDGEEHNSVIDKNDIHYDRKKDKDVKEYTIEDEDEGAEEEVSNGGGAKFECLF